MMFVHNFCLSEVFQAVCLIFASFFKTKAPKIQSTNETNCHMDLLSALCCGVFIRDDGSDMGFANRKTFLAAGDNTECSGP